jgi:hypothetical protein
VTSGRDELDEFEAPSQELVEEALMRTGDLQHRRVFYDGLENPKWVKPLAEANAFQNVPATVVDAEGYLLTTPWPEGDYLIRMAQLVPAEVLAVLEPLKGTEDPYVQRIILRAATHMPAEMVREFLLPVTRLIGGPLRRLLDPKDFVAFISTLAAEGATSKDALKLANAVYRPWPGPVEEGLWPRKRATVGLEEYAYQLSLPALREALEPLGLKTLTQLKIWLEQYQVHSGDYLEDRKRDVSTMTRPSIRTHEQNRGYNRIYESLVDAVRDEAESLLERGFDLDEVLAVLQKSDQPLVQRIALHVVTAAVPSGVSGLEKGRERLFDQCYLDEDFRNEYSHLARAVLPALTSEEADQWLAAVVSGPFEEQDALEQRLERYLQEGETVEQIVQRYREVWRRDVLASIGDEHLPAAATQLLAELIDRWGSPEHPEFPNWMEFKEVTPRGPEGAAELAVKPVGEVAMWLREWHPEEDSHSLDRMTIEGLARALESDVRKRPGDYIEVAEEFAVLDPTYVRALMSGLAEAAKHDLPEEWGPILGLAQSVVAHDEDTDQEVESFDRDGSWRFAQRELLRFVDSALGNESARGSGALPLESFAEILAKLAASPDPTPEYEARYGGDNMDPLTLSLNGVRPVAVSQLADLLLFLQSEEAAGRTAPAGLSESVEEALASRMGAPIDGSLSVAAAFGRSMGKLIDADETWTRSALARLLGEPGVPHEQAYSDIVVSTALATYHPSLKLLTFYAAYYPSMLDRAARGESISVGWQRERTAVELLGDHIAVLVVRGELVMSDPLVEGYFANAMVADRASVLGHLGWGLGREEELPDAIIERAWQFADMRAASVRAGSDVAELSGFAWWAIASHFAPEWWLPILELAVGGGQVDPHGLVGEALEDAATKNPGSALRILTALLSQRTQPFERYGLIEHSPGVLAAALDSGNDEIAESARTLLDLLGRQGELRLADLVAERRRKAQPPG